MPFQFVYGIPDNVTEEELINLRRGIVRVIQKEMEVNIEWVRVFFPTDRAPAPATKADGASTIYVALDTALFHDKENIDETAVRVVSAVCLFVANFFSRHYEVEGFVHDLNPRWKCLIPVEK